MSDYRIGVVVPSTTAPEELIGTSSRVEELGYDELWMSEDYFFLGGFTSAAMALQATTSIPVGMGVVSAVVRHPALTAMEIATLARAFPGRFLMGIGHGVPFWVKQMGIYPKSPLTSLKVAMTSIRALLEGKTLDIDSGPFVFDNVQLVHPVDTPVPLYTGVVGPKSLEVSGELADGTIMSVIAAPKYLEFVREHVAKGAIAAGRDPESHRIPTFAIYHVNEDRQVALDAARQALAFYLQAVGPTPMTGVYGLNDQLNDVLALGDLPAIAAALPQEWVDTFTIAGTPADCVTKIADFHDAGATSVALAPFPSTEGAQMVELTAAEVLPKLR